MCRLQTLVGCENFDIREKFTSVTNLASFPRGCSSDPGRRLSAWGQRMVVPPLLEGLCPLSVCINSTSASSQTSSSVSLCLIPLDKTHMPRPIAPETVAIPLMLFSHTGAFRWESFSLHKVCLATVNSWKSGSNHFTPCRETVSMGPINTRRCAGECRMLGCFASSQTHNQLLSCSSPRGRQSVREPEKVTRNLSTSDKS